MQLAEAGAGPTRSLLEIQIRNHGAVALLKPVGWLSSSNRDQIDAAFKAIVANKVTRFVLDLSSVHFSDNDCMVIFAFWKGMLHDSGGCLILASPGGMVLQALIAGGFNKCLPICDTVTEAVELAMRMTESGRWAPVSV
jgi:anti-anti-sigma factor